jgi:origin recognition complex subunit 1
MSSAPPQTPRRSKRFQPLATPSRTRSDEAVSCTWVGRPLYARSTNRELDLLQEEKDLLENDEEDQDLETLFYQSFEIKRTVAPQFRGGGPSRGKSKKTANETGLDRFSVGDTVLIKTDTLYRTHRPPSVGVILAMWETKVKDGEKGVHEPDPSKMRVRVHWFLRPTELASIRAKRDHTKVGSNDSIFLMSSRH